jgi:hypothetical protein
MREASTYCAAAADLGARAGAKVAVGGKVGA